jgi:hypothetical protein
MARTHNILANETVKTLAYLTVEIKGYGLCCTVMAAFNRLKDKFLLKSHDTIYLW